MNELNQEDILKNELESENERDVELEIISAMFENKSYISYAISKLNAWDFKNIVLRAYFSQIKLLYDENDTVISPSIVKEKILIDELNIDPEEFDLILSQLKYQVNTIDYEFFKKLVDIKKCQSIESSLVKFGNDLTKLKLKTSNVETELNHLNSDFFSITSSWVTNANEKDANFLWEKLLNDIHDRIENSKDNSRFSSEIYSWCLHAVNELLDGFNPEQFYILAARPGVGKTTLALNWTVALAKIAYVLNLDLAKDQKKHCVLFFSLEMSAEQMFDKIISLVSYVDNTKIKKRILNTSDLVKLNSAVERENLLKLPLFFFDDANLSLSKIESIIKEYSTKYIVDLVVIDYLQLVKVGEDRLRFNMNRTNEVAIISKTLKTVALTLKIPVLSLSQLSRRVEASSNEIKKPLLSDLRESGSIEQDADVVMFLYTDGSNKMGNSEEAENISELDREAMKVIFTVEKNRFGAKGTRFLEFSKYCSRFEDSNESFENLNQQDD